MVSYSGTGKYKPGQAIRFWEDIPATDAVFRDWERARRATASGSVVAQEDRLAIPGDYDGWSTIDNPLEPDQSWWSVVCIQFDDESLLDVQARTETHGGTLVLVICFYQFLEDILTGWWMEVLQYWAAANRWGYPAAH